MAVTADRVVVELEARLDRYEADLARAEAKFEQAMDGISSSSSAAEAVVSRAFAYMKAAVAGFTLVGLAQEFLSLSDEAKKLDATLKLATQGFGSFGQAQKDVNRIANDTRSGLSETASLYANFVRGAKELGATQAEAARATETFSKTLKISGADTNQAASATLQFGQALAAGALRGDELNSILEASPRLARLLAESMGQPIGQIKQLGEEGLLTSDKLLKALTDTKFTAGIDAEFNQMPVTFEDAMTRVYNAALTTFSAFDRGGEFSAMLASFVSDGADGFSDLERSAENFGISVRGTLEGLGDAFDPIIDAGREAFRLLGIDLSNFSMNGRKEIAGILGAFDDLLNIGPSVANFFGAGGKYDSRLRERFLKGAEKSDTERRMALIMQGDPLRDAPPPPGKGPPPAQESDAEKKKRLAAERKAAREAERAAREALQREQEDRQYQIDILRARSALTDNVEAKAQFEREMLEIEKQQRLADLKAEKDLSAEQRKARLAAIERLYGGGGTEGGEITVDGGGLLPRAVSRELGKRLEEAANMRAEADYDIAREALEGQERLATTRAQRERIQLQLLELDFQERKRQLERQRDDAKSDDERAAYQARIDALPAQQNAAEKDVRRSNMGALGRYADRLTNADTEQQIEDLITQELDYVQDSISGAITKRLGVKDPFLSGIIDLFIQQNIMRPLAEALAGAGGGGLGGGIIGTIGGLIGFASGGSGTLGGRGGTDRNVLSLNGRPFANVSRGETLSVGSKTLGSRGGGASVVQPIIQVDARGAVMNDQFAQMILTKAHQGAVQTAAAMGQAIHKGIPSRIASFNRDGT